jgi:hypothetical protein
MNSINKKRLERCQDCICLVEDDDHEWSCDWLQNKCINIIECEEWTHDPSLDNERKKE